MKWIDCPSIRVRKCVEPVEAGLLPTPVVAVRPVLHQLAQVGDGIPASHPVPATGRGTGCGRGGPAGPPGRTSSTRMLNGSITSPIDAHSLVTGYLPSHRSGRTGADDQVLSTHQPDGADFDHGPEPYRRTARGRLGRPLLPRRPLLRRRGAGQRAGRLRRRTSGPRSAPWPGPRSACPRSWAEEVPPCWTWSWCASRSAASSPRSRSSRAPWPAGPWRRR